MEVVDTQMPSPLLNVCLSFPFFFFLLPVLLDFNWHLFKEYNNKSCHFTCVRNCQQRLDKLFQQRQLIRDKSDLPNICCLPFSSICRPFSSTKVGTRGFQPSLQCRTIPGAWKAAPAEASVDGLGFAACGPVAQKSPKDGKRFPC